MQMSFEKKWVWIGWLVFPFPINKTKDNLNFGDIRNVLLRNIFVRYICKIFRQLSSNLML